VGEGVDEANVIGRAREALAGSAWAQAYAQLHEVDPSELTALDLEGFADAAWWLSKFSESLELRHRSYNAYAAAGDDLGAGGTAARLAVEHFLRGEPSVGAGFLMRARRHAEGIPEGPEVGFLAMVESVVAQHTGELDRAEELADRAIELGRRFHDRDLLAMAIHAKGLTLIAAGRVRDGLALLDEAMAVVLEGDLSPYFTGVVFCSVIGACLELGDIGRAGEWSDAARAWCETLAPDSPFPPMCRVNRSEVARLRGSWPEAEAEARRAADELMGIDQGPAGGSAFSQLGEIRRCVGDLAGAEAAFERARELGDDPQPGLALLRLAQRKVEAARTALRSALAAERHPPRRARLLAAQVEAALAAGAVDEAHAAADELGTIAAATEFPLFAAAAATAAGSVALADGDVDQAIGALRSATDTWRELRLPRETAVARTLLGRALLAAGDDEAARVELGAALAEFERLGADPDVAMLRGVLGAPSPLPGGLTAREVEVLRLVAAGKTNRDIAVELVISEHTVSRHLQNTFAKLGVSSRAAATAYAFEHGLA
jgi:ATP/maltotriose-dependent transcriptional regulator MalT